ncbi:uncharacterized protein DEA37_0006174 [Paragonimus westermani]|uniref:BZIP domain-containing protein n=1 Tax=Paragonimus westermani TaxID=34504 RepID=A0A5J4P2H0_9TREM|nr:uncharacterized protein DEA37_0006174 [Paragonimus westermani]
MSYPYPGFLSTYGGVHSQLRCDGPLCSQHEFVRNTCDANIYSTTVHSSRIKYAVDQEHSAIAHQTSEHRTHPETHVFLSLATRLFTETISYVFRNADNQQQDATSFLPNDHISGDFTSNDQAAVCCSSTYMNEWNHLDAEFIEHKRGLGGCATFGRGNPLEYRKSSHYCSPSCCEQMGLDTKEYPITADTFNFLDSPYAWEPPQNLAIAVSKGKVDSSYIGMQSKCGIVNTPTGLPVCASGSPNRTPGNYQKTIDCGTHTSLSNLTTEYRMNPTNSDHSSDHLATYNPALRSALDIPVSTNTYFWQYNSQCKGPKAIRLVKLDGSPVRSENNSDEPDSTVGLWMGLDLFESSASASGSMIGEVTSSFPKSYTHSTLSLPDYPLIVFEDPVQRRYDLVHCSKLRRGDGNDVTPNLTRLRAMGEELDKLSQLLIKHGEVIMAGTSANTSLTSMVFGEQSTDIKCDRLSPEHRLIEQAKREKNKLASKVCRLKKKAFHEANKIKYTGLGLEYDELAIIIIRIRKMICEHLRLGTSMKITEGSFGHFSSEQFDLQARQSGTYGSQTCTEQDRYGTNGGSIGSVFGTNGSTFERSTSSLLTRAVQTYEKLNVTHAAARLDPLVDEVLRHFRAGDLSHPLVRGMTMNVLGTLETINDATQNQIVKSSVFGVEVPACLNDYPASTGAQANRCSMNDYFHYTQAVQPPPKFTVTYHSDCVTDQPNQFC